MHSIVCAILRRNAFLHMFGEHKQNGFTFDKKSYGRVQSYVSANGIQFKIMDSVIEINPEQFSVYIQLPCLLTNYSCLNVDNLLLYGSKFSRTRVT